MKKKILELRPTQFSLGNKDVEDKVNKLLAHGSHPDKKVPVIKGPSDQLYMIDHHHYVRAMWECGEEHVNVEIKADLSKLSKKKFWSAMKKMKWAFLYDQLGHGPHLPTYLPDDIRGMGDNKYRSLAWMIRELGGYEKSTKPFAEFYWGEFFRKRLKAADPFCQSSIDKCMKLCKSKAAKSLPGFKK